jgi:hypothetical protein
LIITGVERRRGQREERRDGATSDGQEAFVTETIGLYRKTATPGQPRDKAEIEALFAGYDLVEPGVTWAPLWHPDEPSPFEQEPRRSSIYVGVGRKPA